MLHIIALIILFLVIWFILELWIDDLITSFLMTILSMLSLPAISLTTMSETNIDNSTVIKEIYTLEDNQYSNKEGKVSGNFLFVYGKTTTKDGLNYSTMVGSDSDGYLVKTFDASETYLFMDGGKSPFVEYVYKQVEYKSSWVSRFFYIGDKTESTLYRVNLHIPKEAVAIKYNVDLE